MGVRGETVAILRHGAEDGATMAARDFRLIRNPAPWRPEHRGRVQSAIGATFAGMDDATFGRYLETIPAEHHAAARSIRAKYAQPAAQA